MLLDFIINKEAKIIILKVPKGQIWTIIGSIDIRHKMAMQDLIRMGFIDDYERRV